MIKLTKKINSKIIVNQNNIKVVDLQTGGAYLDSEDLVGHVLNDESTITAILQKRDGKYFI